MTSPARLRWTGFNVNERTVNGRPVNEIARLADELAADLIVTGTLGGGPFRRHVIGSTAERIVRKSARPVLMVRQLPHESYRRALVAVDFSRWSAPSLAGGGGTRRALRADAGLRIP